MSCDIQSDVEKAGEIKQRHHQTANLHSAPSNESQSSGDNAPPLPKGCKPLAHQVAGHRYGQGRLKLGMLQHVDGSILKPVQPPPRGEREVNFYHTVFNPACADPVLQTLRPFLPKFLGLSTPVTFGEDDGAPTQYLKLEDACRRFRNPSIMDIKIGRVSYDPEADAEKIAIESKKYLPLQKLGFQLLGMRVPGPSQNEAIFYDKTWGRSLTEEKINDGLEIFFSGNKAWRKHLIKAFLQRLETILIWFESQNQLQFYSSSLLFIYEGEFFDGSSDSDEEFRKYRSSLLPNQYSEYYRAIDKVLQANIKQTKESPLEENTELMNNSPAQSSNAACVKDQSVKNDGKDSEDKKDIKSITQPRDQSQTRSTFKVPIGSESGYSSEVDSKKKIISDVRNQREFVNNLSQRMRQHAMIQYSKYRFPPDLVDVRMIDFAHVFEEPVQDENYIYGLRNLIAHFRHLLKHS